MKHKTLAISFKVVGFIICLFGNTSHSLAENMVDFSKGTNLKTIYDAGLRPWRVRPDERSSLKIVNEDLTVVVPNGHSFPINVQIGNISVLEGNELSKVDFVSRPMSLEQAGASAEQACIALGVDTMGLREILSNLARLGDQTPSPQSWNGRGNGDGFRYSVTLSPLFGMNETRGKVFVTLDFYKRGMPMKFLTEPIKPPPGYEHMSMAPPETNPEKPFPDPAYSAENIKKRVEKKSADSEQISTSSTAAARMHDQRAGEELPRVSVKRQFLVISVVIAVIVVGAGFLLRRGRRKN